MIIYCNTENHTLKDGENNLLAIEQAREAWENGDVTDCNCAFVRFARLNNFGFDSLNEYYDNN